MAIWTHVIAPAVCGINEKRTLEKAWFEEWKLQEDDEGGNQES